MRKRDNLLTGGGIRAKGFDCNKVCVNTGPVGGEGINIIVDMRKCVKKVQTKQCKQYIKFQLMVLLTR
jgi:hypothetical protein